MKPAKSIHQRPWCPMGFVTQSGLLLSPSHVAHVCAQEEQQEEQQAARTTTKIINRMMKP